LVDQIKAIRKVATAAAVSVLSGNQTVRHTTIGVVAASNARVSFAGGVSTFVHVRKETASAISFVGANHTIRKTSPLIHQAARVTMVGGTTHFGFGVGNAGGNLQFHSGEHVVKARHRGRPVPDPEAEFVSKGAGSRLVGAGGRAKLLTRAPSYAGSGDRYGGTY
jgi:hypothetical protein